MFVIKTPIKPICKIRILVRPNLTHLGGFPSHGHRTYIQYIDSYMFYRLCLLCIYNYGWSLNANTDNFKNSKYDNHDSVFYGNHTIKISILPIPNFKLSMYSLDSLADSKVLFHLSNFTNKLMKYI